MSEESAMTAFRRAENLLKQRRPVECLRALEPVLQVWESKRSVQLLAGRAYFFSAQFSRAENAFRALLEADPSDDYARMVLGRTLQRQGRLEEARTQLKLAVTMNPVPEYQEALGEVRARLAVRDS